MEPEIIKFNSEKFKFYDGLTDKYLEYSFNSPEEEKIFIEHLKALLCESNEDIEFELKLWFVNMLVSGINVKNIGAIDYSSNPSK